MSIEIRDIIPEEEFDQTTLPKAIAIRFWRESAAVNEKNPFSDKDNPPSPLILEERIVLTARILEELFNYPDRQEQTFEKMWQFTISEQLEERFDQPDKSEEKTKSSIDSDKAVQMMTQGIVELLKPLFSSVLERTLAIKTAAEKIANEKAVSPARVYLDENLYQQLIRSSYTAEQYTAITEQIPNYISAKNSLKLL